MHTKDENKIKNNIKNDEDGQEKKIHRGIEFYLDHTPLANTHNSLTQCAYDKIDLNGLRFCCVNDMQRFTSFSM